MSIKTKIIQNNTTKHNGVCRQNKTRITATPNGWTNASRVVIAIPVLASLHVTP